MVTEDTIGTVKSGNATRSNNNNDLTLFRRLWQRLEGLERWRELALRPEDMWEEDKEDLLDENDEDILANITKRCHDVRNLVNEHLPIVPGPHDDVLMAKLSQIPSAGDGLYYEGSTAFPEGHVLCYYYGHIHNFRSIKSLTDKRYLMLVNDILVDPGPCPNILARYINDPLNDDLVNVKFVPQPTSYRSAVVTTREIQPREELFGSYGEAYWSQQEATLGRVLRK